VSRKGAVLTQLYQAKSRRVFLLYDSCPSACFLNSHLHSAKSTTPETQAGTEGASRGFDGEYRVPGRSVGPPAQGYLFAFTSYLGTWRAMVMGAFGDNAAYSGVASTTGTSPTWASSISWVMAVFLVARLFRTWTAAYFALTSFAWFRCRSWEVLNRWLWPLPWALFGCSAAEGFLLPSGCD
jgi:hypothetical protein